MDDIWDNGHTELNEPSDLPRLQQAHSTAGYRDGITAAKASTVQAGFDEGYGLGATIGLRAGELLGLLEGIASALPGDERLKLLVDDARGELAVQSIFGKEYWEGDGTWRYELPEGEETFGDVAGGHPLIKKWGRVVSGEMGRVGVIREVLREDGHEHEHGEGEGRGHGERGVKGKGKGDGKGEAREGRKGLKW
ncbi:hypothetical protein OQA88_4222 [Cercophora sp. LCS_1]